MAFGLPGTLSGHVMRGLQLFTAAVSMVLMLTAHHYTLFPAFGFLVYAMGLVVFWSVICIVIEVRALLSHIDIRDRSHLGMLGVGHWILSMISLAGIASSLGVIAFYVFDKRADWVARHHSYDTMYFYSAVFGFLSWFLQAYTGCTMLWAFFGLFRDH